MTTTTMRKRMTNKPETTDAEDRALLQREKEKILREAKAFAARIQAQRLLTASRKSHPPKR